MIHLIPPSWDDTVKGSDRISREQLFQLETFIQRLAWVIHFSGSVALYWSDCPEACKRRDRRRRCSTRQAGPSECFRGTSLLRKTFCHPPCLVVLYLYDGIQPASMQTSRYLRKVILCAAYDVSGKVCFGQLTTCREHCPLDQFKEEDSHHLPPTYCTVNTQSIAHCSLLTAIREFSLVEMRQWLSIVAESLCQFKGPMNLEIAPHTRSCICKLFTRSCRCKLFSQLPPNLWRDMVMSILHLAQGKKTIEWCIHTCQPSALYLDNIVMKRRQV
jgi:hypothetical protein